MPHQWTIGLHMTAGDEQTRRQVEGMLQYVAEHPELTVRDFFIRRPTQPLGDSAVGGEG